MPAWGSATRLLAAWLNRPSRKTIGHSPSSGMDLRNGWTRTTWPAAWSRATWDVASSCWSAPYDAASTLPAPTAGFTTTPPGGKARR